MQHWLFKGTDTYFRHVDYARENKIVFAWASQNSSKIRPGDGAFLWVRSDRSPLGEMGIYARGETSAVHPDGRPSEAPDDSAYWIDPAKRDRSKPHVAIRITALYDRPETFRGASRLKRAIDRAKFLNAHRQSCYEVDGRGLAGIEAAIAGTLQLSNPKRSE